MAYDKCNLERDSSIGASSIPARVNIGARVSRGGLRPFRSADTHRQSGLSGCPFRSGFVFARNVHVLGTFWEITE